MDPLLVSPPEAAKTLGISARKLWGLTAINAIPHRRVGRLIRYAPNELLRWVAAGCPTDAGAADRIRSEGKR